MTTATDWSHLIEADNSEVVGQIQPPPMNMRDRITPAGVLNFLFAQDYDCPFYHSGDNSLYYCGGSIVIEQFVIVLLFVWSLDRNI